MRRLLPLVSTLALAACGIGADTQEGPAAPASGSGTQRSYQVAAFDSVSLSGYQNVIVTVGPAVSVRAEGDEGELERLEIRNDGNRLHIGQKYRADGNSGDHSPVTVYVTVPSLAKAAIGGSGDMRIDTVRGQSFEAAIGGSGDMQIGALQVENARFSVAGAGSIRTAGQAAGVNVEVAGSGGVDASGLESRSAQVSVIGSGDVRVHASETANISIMGSGDVTVAGPARCTVNNMGSGNVRCGS